MSDGARPEGFSEQARPVGYRLVRDDGAVLREWGGAWGQHVAVPDDVVLPNGDIVPGRPEVGTRFGLDPRTYVDTILDPDWRPDEAAGQTEADRPETRVVRVGPGEEGRTAMLVEWWQEPPPPEPPPPPDPARVKRRAAMAGAKTFTAFRDAYLADFDSHT